ISDGGIQRLVIGVRDSTSVPCPILATFFCRKGGYHNAESGCSLRPKFSFNKPAPPHPPASRSPRNRTDPPRSSPRSCGARCTRTVRTRRQKLPAASQAPQARAVTPPAPLPPVAARPSVPTQPYLPPSSAKTLHDATADCLPPPESPIRNPRG